MGLEWKQLVPFVMKVDDCPRVDIEAHPEVQVVGAHMKLEFYEKPMGRG